MLNFFHIILKLDALFIALLNISIFEALASARFPAAIEAMEDIVVTGPEDGDI